MRVLVMHNGGRSSFASGETYVFHDEVAALREAGTEVETLFVSPPERESFSQRVSAAARVLWSRHSYRTVRDTIAQLHPDVVHVHGVLPDLTVAALAACRDANVPVVQTLHNYRWLCIEGGLYRNERTCHQCVGGRLSPGLRNRCARGSLVASVLLTANNHRHVRSGRLFQWIQRFVAVSHYARQQHVDAGFPEDRVLVKYNGVTPAARDQIVPRDRRDGRICFVGRLDPAKGTSILRQLVEGHPSWRWTIIGDGPERATWAQLQRSLAPDQLRVLGQRARDEVRQHLTTASLVVVPSRVPETFGLVAAEAMAVGTPVVASAVGGLTELVGHSGGGILVAPEQPCGFYAAAIDALVTAPSHWQQASEAGHRFACRQLDRSVLTNDLLAIYQKLRDEYGRS